MGTDLGTLGVRYVSCHEDLPVALLVNKRSVGENVGRGDRMKMNGRCRAELSPDETVGVW